ncbi:MAG: class I SAM-dependent methyltransferase [Actinomycetota bacterium]
MKLPEPEKNWPASWSTSYAFDLIEVEGLASRATQGHRYAYKARVDYVIALVRRTVPLGATVLDVGAGQGNLTLWLAELGFAVTWNDVRDELAGYVRLKHQSGSVNYLAGEITALEPSAKYDLVLAAEIIEHVAHPDRFLAHLGRFVKPGGHLVITTPNGSYLRNRLPRFTGHPDPSIFEKHQYLPDADGHIFLLHPDEIEALSDQAGLRVVRLDLITNFLTAGWLGTSLFLHRLPPALVRLGERATGALPGLLKEKLTTQLIILLRRQNA